MSSSSSSFKDAQIPNPQASTSLTIPSQEFVRTIGGVSESPRSISLLIQQNIADKSLKKEGDGEKENDFKMPIPIVVSMVQPGLTHIASPKPLPSLSSTAFSRYSLGSYSLFLFPLLHLRFLIDTFYFS
jgi:hypothetical protein